MTLPTFPRAPTALLLLFAAATVAAFSACRSPSIDTLPTDTLVVTAVAHSVEPPTSRPTNQIVATSALPPTTTARPTGTLQPTETPQPTATEPPPTPSPTYATHVVQSQETLLGIAARYGLSVDDLVKANQLVDPNLLQLGQALNVPAAPAALTPIPFPDRDYGYTIIGYSVQGRAIEAFSFGQGPQHVVFVGGIHGGYEWNTVLLAYQIIDYLNGNRDQIPPAVTVHIIPAANPDGLYLVTAREGRFFPEQVIAETTPGRFNANNVDLNRNWSCNWSAAAEWGRTRVFPGNGPFSEPETRALRDYFTSLAPRSVVLWHSAAGGLVAPGLCAGDDGGSGQLAQVYGAAAGYAVGPFSAYDVTGSASDWLVSQGIPAIAVELITHESTEYGRNLAGVQAVLDLYRD